jgi:hypothetical protein
MRPGRRASEARCRPFSLLTGRKQGEWRAYGAILLKNLFDSNGLLKNHVPAEQDGKGR